MYVYSYIFKKSQTFSQEKENLQKYINILPARNWLYFIFEKNKIKKNMAYMYPFFGFLKLNGNVY